MNEEMCQIRRIMMNQDSTNQQKHDEIHRILKRKWTFTVIVSQEEGGSGNGEGKVRKSQGGDVDSEAKDHTLEIMRWSADECWEGLSDTELIKACDDVVRRKVQ